VLYNAAEIVKVSGSNNNSNPTAFFDSGSITYWTGNNGTNWVQNLTFSFGEFLNTVMSTGQSLTTAVLSTNGATAYYPTSITVDGTSSGVTVKWQGGTAPTTGNASSIDAYVYTVIKTGAATFTVLASQTKFA
jgi:hypothetical protein